MEALTVATGRYDHRSFIDRHMADETCDARWWREVLKNLLAACPQIRSPETELALLTRLEAHQAEVNYWKEHLA